MRKDLTFMLFSLNILNSRVIAEKHQTNPNVREILQNISPGFFETVKVVPNKEELRNCHRSEDTKEKR